MLGLISRDLPSLPMRRGVHRKYQDGHICLQSKIKEVKEAVAIRTRPSRTLQLLCASRLVSLIAAARQSTQSAQQPKGPGAQKAEEATADGPDQSAPGALPIL